MIRISTIRDTMVLVSRETYEASFRCGQAPPETVYSQRRRFSVSCRVPCRPCARLSSLSTRPRPVSVLGTEASTPFVVHSPSSSSLSSSSLSSFFPSSFSSSRSFSLIGRCYHHCHLHLHCCLHPRRRLLFCRHLQYWYVVVRRERVAEAPSSSGH